MIPLADENPSGKRPYVVYVLIALNVLFYAVDYLSRQVIGGIPVDGLWNFSMVPAAVVSNGPVAVYVPYGRYLVPLLHAGLHPQWLTIFTSMFMHGGLLHIGGNMLYLWVFGNNIEEALGHFKFLLFYLTCGVLAALAHIYSNPMSTVPTVGASGAIAGVLGAYLYMYPGNRVTTLIPLGWYFYDAEVPAVFVLGVWFVTQLTNLWGSGGFQHGGGVAYWAHVGGFVAGVVLIMLLGGRKLRKPDSRYGQNRTRPFRRWR